MVHFAYKSKTKPLIADRFTFSGKRHPKQPILNCLKQYFYWCGI